MVSFWDTRKTTPRFEHHRFHVHSKGGRFVVASRTLVVPASGVFDETVLTRAEASPTNRRFVIVFDFCSDVAMDRQIAL